VRVVSASGSAKPQDVFFEWAGLLAVSRAGNRMMLGGLPSKVLPGDSRHLWRFRLSDSREALGHAVRFAPSLLSDFSPQYSPDGKRVVFETGPAILVADADGSNVMELYSEPLKGSGTPRWSPDGEWVAFDCGEFAVGWKVYVIRSGVANRCC
jgi:hypothetical protein